MKVYERLARLLAEAGVDRVFGLMGDANLRHLVSWIEDVGGRFVPTVAEGGAVSMADGYARVTGRLGVASVTHGPGMTNTLTALTEAVRADTPLALLTGSTTARPGHLQRLDIAAAVSLAGADYARVQRPDTAAGEIRAALRRPLLTRRPVVIDVPVDLAALDDGAGGGPAAARVGDVRRPASVPGDDELDQALGIIASARQPLVLAGRGAVDAGARDALLGLARQLGAPVATTLLAREYFGPPGTAAGGECARLGIVGTIGSAAANDAALAADCVIAFGASLNRYTTVDGALLRDRAIVQVDHAAERIGQLAPPDAALAGDAARTARLLTAALGEAGHEGKPWLTAMPPGPGSDGGDDEGPLDLDAAMALLDDLLPAGRRVVTDTGRFVYGAWRRLRVTDPRDFAHTLNFASIGLGIATAVGAATASADKVTVAVVGDGGGMMGMGELATAVRERLPLLIVVANDAAYGMEYVALKRAGLDTAHSRLTWPEFAGLARGYGARGYTARTMGELRAALAATFPEDGGLDGPVVIDLKVDPASVPG